jgi:hypothetical protein
LGGDRTNPLMRNMPACNACVPNYTALAALGKRLHVAVGADSGQEVAARGGYGLSQGLGREVDLILPRRNEHYSRGAEVIQFEDRLVRPMF